MSIVVLDTNVMSELMRDNPNHKVVDWFDAQHINNLSITTITQAEILHQVLNSYQMENVNIISLN